MPGAWADLRSAPSCDQWLPIERVARAFCPGGDVHADCDSEATGAAWTALIDADMDLWAFEHGLRERLVPLGVDADLFAVARAETFRAGKTTVLAVTFALNNERVLVGDGFEHLTARKVFAALDKCKIGDSAETVWARIKAAA